MLNLTFCSSFRHSWLWLPVLLLTIAASFPAYPKPSFTLFESGQVRPLALSPDGRHLFAVNTPDNRLEVFRITRQGLQHISSVPVGMEPVAVAVRSDTEVWVVNHLSDSISIVNLESPSTFRVVRTLLVGDEPRDIVFAGLHRHLAFITTAHRGQNTQRDAQLYSPGVGRADVWVFNSTALGDSLGGDPLTVLTLFTDTPRALAVSPDGSIVYAAGFHTGNQTTTINQFLVKNAIATAKDPCSGLDRSYPGPITNHAFAPQPDVGLIVKFDGQHWRDELHQCWDDQVLFTLPDADVFSIDAAVQPLPKLLPNGEFRGVGTVLFNMVVNPLSGLVYVANTDAQNQNRFEGTGIFSAGKTVRGHTHESRITVLTPGGKVQPRHLNKHIDYSHCCAPIPNEENAKSVAFPMQMAINHDGSMLYVPMFGTSEIGVYKTQALESDSFVPDTADQIPVSGGGPSGAVLDEARNRLYVLTRFDNSISVIDTGLEAEILHLALFNPEPQHIVAGRRFLYDASFTSSHGDSACASCHVFGDFDSLAWDLGDPDADLTYNSGPLRIPEGIGFYLLRGSPETSHFRPMKGPMVTQSLRGLANHGSMHWRGDRTGGNNAILNNPVTPNAQPDGGSFDESLAFRKFNTAFQGLNGRNAFIPDADMQLFTDFVLEITYPPNPIRNLDNSLTASQQAGRDIFCGPSPLNVECNAGNKSDTFFACNGCHVLDRDGNARFPEVKKPGFFGTDGQFAFEGESQFFKVPHLRNLYQKVGMFGMPPNPPFPTALTPPGSLVFLPFADTPLPADKIQQVRGFGFLHDGSLDTVFRFVSASVFLQRPPSPSLGSDPRTPPELLDANGKDFGNLGGFANPAIPIPGQDFVTGRRDVEAFLLAFDSNLAPIVGQQITLNRRNAKVVAARIDLLMARAELKECELIAKNRDYGYLYIGNGKFKVSSKFSPVINDRALRDSARFPKGELTYTCVPPGSGIRMALDRNGDQILDADARHRHPGHRKSYFN